MSELTMTREYRLKFYLNARHYIIIGGTKGEVHPHTWEFALRIKFGKDEFAPFSTFEKGVEDFFNTYQNQVMNDIPPFDSVTPTLENIADYFAKELYEVIDNVGGRLVRLEAAETPTRSYMLNLEEDHEFSGIAVAESPKRVTQVIDAVLDEAIGKINEK
ncbi:MAG: 6-carboxytetrahydropterin synthase [Lachnospiraceae bacterium]|nr:6-carboxytetrahydropterin synthase [Lachnospiraceae bacterium]